MNEVTRILSAIEHGDPKAAEQLLPLVYDELRKLAAQRLTQEKPGQTLQATALVHESYLRLVGTRRVGGMGDVGGISSRQPPRRCAVSSSRMPAARSDSSGGGDLRRVDLDQADEKGELDDERLLDLDEALDKLDREDPQATQLVKLRFFTGLSITDAAGVIGISRAKAYEQWAYARAWLRCEVEDREEG